MTISYNWLHDYLPVSLDPDRLGRILTSIGLEVESMEKFESHKGGLQGLVIGQVLESSAHPNANKLKVTKVNVGQQRDRERRRVSRPSSEFQCQPALNGVRSCFLQT